MKGITLHQTYTFNGNFEHDCILMISKSDGTFITARQFTQLLKLSATIVDNNESTKVWSNHFTSQISSIRVNQFFSQILQKDVQLRRAYHNLTKKTNIIHKYLLVLPVTILIYY